MRLPSEFILTNVPGIRTLANMYKLVPCNMRFPTEWFLQTLQAKGHWPICISWCLLI
jgi:hypothetical protein